MEWALYSFSTDLLTCILGHVDLRDIKHVFLTCKRWSTLGGCAQFWQPFVAKKLAPFPIKGITAGMLLKLLETPRKAFEWVFGKDVAMRPAYFILSHFLKFVCDSERKSVVELFVYNEDNLEVINFNLVKDTGVITYHFTEGRTEKLNWIVYRTDQNIVYKGEATEIPRRDGISFTLKCTKTKPEGSGTWTFPDGSTFSGENVALGGLPHGKGLWNNTEEVEFDFGHKIIHGSQKRRKIKWN